MSKKKPPLVGPEDGDWFEIQVADDMWRLFRVTALIWGEPWGRWVDNSREFVRMDTVAPRRKATPPGDTSRVNATSHEELDPLKRR